MDAMDELSEGVGENVLHDPPTTLENTWSTSYFLRPYFEKLLPLNFTLKKVGKIMVEFC